jgi:hypothetical protein
MGGRVEERGGRGEKINTGRNAGQSRDFSVNSDVLLRCREGKKSIS